MSRGKSAFYVDRAGGSRGSQRDLRTAGGGPRGFRREFCLSVKGMAVGNAGAWRRDLTADPYAILTAAVALYGLSLNCMFEGRFHGLTRPSGSPRSVVTSGRWQASCRLIARHMTVYVGILPADADAGGCNVRVWSGITAYLMVASWQVRVQPSKHGVTFPANGLRRAEFGIFLL